ncbi:MAG: ABC transporter substrate-binding protein [Anaerolineaceae bacterium]|nr:MAG: ABC transporter substrate-binding protein [Anaerolineaceae bacterium]
MKKVLIFVVVFLLGIVVLAACGRSSETAQEASELLRLRLPMGYIPDPQYAPIYVAVEKGYFAEEGFDIEFDYSFETDGMALVGANELPFAIVGGDQVILARAQGLPVVYVLEWYQRYPIAVVSKASAGIEAPADLAGRTVGLPGFFGASYVGYVGLLLANDLAQDEVDAIDVGFTQVEALLSDQAEAVVVFANNEPIQLANMGEEVNVIQVADYIDLVFNGIVTNEETVQNDPELIEGFTRAMLRGLADTLADPDEAYETSKKYVEGLDDSRRNVLESSLDMWDAETLGYTEAATWDRTQEILLEMGLLDEPIENLEAAYSNEFIQNSQP